MNQKQKRNRSLNWDEEEKLLFRSVLKEYAHVIENKSLDNNTNKKKAEAWEQIHKKFNELNGRHRQLNQLKIQWKSMKVNVQKPYSTFSFKSRKVQDHDDYVCSMISDSKIREEEHRRRMEMAEKEHKITMAIHEEKLRTAMLERLILEKKLQMLKLQMIE